MPKIKAFRSPIVILSIVVMLNILSACNKEEPIFELLTVTIDANYRTTAEKWILVSDTDGNVFDYRKISSGETATLSSSGAAPADKVTLTILEVSTFAFDNTKVKVYDLYTYSDIIAKSTWTIKPGIDEVPPGIGPLTINSTMPAQWTEFFVTNKYGRHIILNNTGGIQSQIGLFHQGADKLNMIYRTVGSQTVKHKLFANVKAGDIFDVNVDDFIEYDTKLQFTFPGRLISFISYGYESDWKYPKSGFLVDFHLGGDFSATGYNSALSQYSTSISIGFTAGNRIEYHKVGSFPSPNISWPDHTKYVVTNPKLYEFVSNVTGTFL